MTPPVANLIIAGVTKAGTTALLHYLEQHPAICAERHKESQPLLTEQGGRADLAVAYQEQFGHCRGEPWRLESSPAYFPVGPDLLERSGEPTSEMRVLIILRDPVTRIWSGYRMKRSKGLLPAGSFRDFVETGLYGELPDGDERLYRVFDTSRYAAHLHPWLERLGDRCLPLFFEDLVADTPAVLRSICDWLGIDPAPVDDFDLAVHNRGVLHRNSGLHTAAGWFNRTLAVSLRRLPGLRSRLLQAYELLNTEEFSEEVDSATRARLRTAYRGDAQALRRLLHDHGHDRVPAWLEDRRARPHQRSRSTPWSTTPATTDPTIRG